MKMPLNSCYTLEICVDSPKTIFAAASIADRIELCTALELGGLTPDYGLMVSAAECGVETHVLIRACAGDFCMNNEELATATTNIGLARQLGLKGVVIGAERAGKLDLRALEHMVKAADGLDMTLHRVIDVVDDPITAVSEVVDLGFTRILTSGGKPTAVEGIDGLRRLHEAADNKIEIMAGGGINGANLPDLLAHTGLTSFHASCSVETPVINPRQGFGFGQSERKFDHAEATSLAALLRAKLPSDQ